ncbi:MAG: hypothetical protein QOD07_496 [Frankiaceae bacterium]|nr:hypothetical protein [Frankiaceae bacterium]
MNLSRYSRAKLALLAIVPALAVTAPATIAATTSVPPVNVCMSAKVVCVMKAKTHSATFAGNWNTKTHGTSDTSASTGTCADGAVAQICRVLFTNGNVKTVCTPNTTTPWYSAPAGAHAWVYMPDAGDSSAQITGDQLFAEGGGVVDANAVENTADGDVVIYRIHIHIAGLCGNEDTAQGIADNISATSGLGSLDTSKVYSFDGYFDIV